MPYNKPLKVIKKVYGCKQLKVSQTSRIYGLNYPLENYSPWLRTESIGHKQIITYIIPYIICYIIYLNIQCNISLLLTSTKYCEVGYLWYLGCPRLTLSAFAKEAVFNLESQSCVVSTFSRLLMSRIQQFVELLNSLLPLQCQP